jgi:prepilin-type N-terminal cleavage/methylation domain-containing protein
VRLGRSDRCIRRIFRLTSEYGEPRVPLRDRPRNSEGFTLIELLIVITIIPLIIGALSLGLITILNLQSGISTRTSDAGDAQVVSSTFLKDVQSAAMVTEEPALACGSGMTYTSTPTQLLGLEWGANGGSFVNAISYITEQNPGLSTFSLFRQLCTNGVTTSAAVVTTVATDLSAGGAISLPYIQCAPLASAPDSNCSATFVKSNWMNAGDAQFVLLSAQENALLPKPNNNVPFQLTLSATPRVHLEANSAPTGGDSAPLTTLGTSCSTPSLDITNNVTVSINVAGGIGNGTIGLAAKCPAVEVDNGGALNAGSVLTTNPALDSVYGMPGHTPYPIPEQFASTIVDPYASLQPPSTSETGLAAGQCTQTAGTWNCTAGYYRTDPGSAFGNGSTVNFSTTGCTVDPTYLNACRFLFEKGLSFPNQVNANFGTAVYVFENAAGSSALTAGTNANINGAINGSTQLLFYVASGSVTFPPGLTINMAGFSGMKGVTIWDASTVDPMVIGNNSNGGALAGYGGLYVPNIGVQINNDSGGTITFSFVVAQSLTFKQNLTIDIVQ